MGYLETNGWWRKPSSTVWSLYAPNGTTGNYFYLYPNTADTNNYILMIGNGNCKFSVPAGSAYVFRCGSDYLSLYYATPDIEFRGLADKNIFLNPTGTGSVKFGTHVGSGDVVCNGSISILDSGGTARKLMTTA